MDTGVFPFLRGAATDPTLTYPAVPASVGKALKKGASRSGKWTVEIRRLCGAVSRGRPDLGPHDAEIESKVNGNGSGISLGHPIGATGTMRLVTLMHEMKRRNARWGLETICGGGGQGICMIVERN